MPTAGNRLLFVGITLMDVRRFFKFSNLQTEKTTISTDAPTDRRTDGPTNGGDDGDPTGQPNPIGI